MMTGSKVRLTNVHSLILTTNHNNIGIKMKDIERQIKQKRNHLLICDHFKDINFRKCKFFNIIEINYNSYNTCIKPSKAKT
jgi:hypothetical protein